jgi:hypothetical protein
MTTATGTEHSNNDDDSKVLANKRKRGVKKPPMDPHK